MIEQRSGADGDEDLSGPHHRLGNLAKHCGRCALDHDVRARGQLAGGDDVGRRSESRHPRPRSCVIARRHRAQGQAVDLAGVDAPCDLEADGAETTDANGMDAALRTHDGLRPACRERAGAACRRARNMAHAVAPVAQSPGDFRQPRTATRIRAVHPAGGEIWIRAAAGRFAGMLQSTGQSTIVPSRPDLSHNVAERTRERSTRSGGAGKARIGPAREARRTARARWPVRTFRLEDPPGPDLFAATTADERPAMMWPPAPDAWAPAGRTMPDYPRNRMPVRVIRPDGGGAR